MPVPNTINDLSTTATSNSPGGNENPFPELDDHLRKGYSFIAQLRDLVATKLSTSSVSAFIQTLFDDTDAAAARNTLGAVGKTGDETVAGVKTFTSSPVVPTPTGGTDAANKDYVDGATPDASTTVKGKVQLATAAEAVALSDALKALTPSTLAGAFQSGNQLLAARGYQKLPGGLIVQWGTEAGRGFDFGVNFPIPFPTAALVVSATMLGAPAGNVSLSCTVDQISATSCAFRPRYATGGSAGAPSEGFNWIALGY